MHLTPEKDCEIFFMRQDVEARVTNLDSRPPLAKDGSKPMPLDESNSKRFVTKRCKKPVTITEVNPIEAAFVKQ